MIAFFITIFIFAWKLALIFLGLVFGAMILFWLTRWSLWLLGVILEPFNTSFKRLGVKTWEERKQEYKQGQEPGWFDKLNLWWEGNNENK